MREHAPQDSIWLRCVIRTGGKKKIAAFCVLEPALLKIAHSRKIPKTHDLLKLAR